MTYYVYRPVGKIGYWIDWRLVSTHDDLDEAEKAAEKLCRAKDIYTEPGGGLQRMYFGPKSGDRWSAKIETQDTRLSPRPPRRIESGL